MRVQRLNQAGYTLTEMVVLMGIVIVLTGLVLANTRVGDKRQELRDAANQFVSTARQAESMAAASQDVSGTSRKAYGVCVSSNGTQCGTTGAGTHYLLYGRPLGQTDYSNPPILSAADIVSTFSLPRQVSLTPAAYWIDYLPPSPTMKLKGTDASAPILTVSTSGYQQTVRTRTKAGAIYVAN